MRLLIFCHHEVKRIWMNSNLTFFAKISVTTPTNCYASSSRTKPFPPMMMYNNTCCMIRLAPHLFIPQFISIPRVKPHLYRLPYNNWNYRIYLTAFLHSLCYFAYIISSAEIYVIDLLISVRNISQPLGNCMPSLVTIK